MKKLSKSEQLAIEKEIFLLRRDLDRLKVKAFEIFLNYDGIWEKEKGITNARISYLNEKLQKIIKAETREEILGMFHPLVRRVIMESFELGLDKKGIKDLHL